MRSPSPTRLFIHGAGRRGRDAWPEISTTNGEFLSFEPGSSIAEQMETIRDVCGDRRLTLFAHSIGAVPAVLAARSLDLSGLVLVEPALYDIARGNPAVERHISAVTEARAQAEDGNLRGFWAIQRPLMFGGPFDEDRWEAEQEVAAHWSTTNAPWGHGIRPEMLAGIATLVITGGWNAEYEVIAALLADHGAACRILTGAAHRPQDVVGFAALVDEFERSLVS